MRQHKVMNCKDWDPQKFNPNSCVGIKYDGVRGFYYPGESELWSRQNKILLGHGHLVDMFKKQDQVQDIEIFIPGKEFNEASGLIRNHQACPSSVAGIIDTPSHPGNTADRLAARLEDTDGAPVFRIPHFRINSIGHVNHYYQKYVPEFEGLVIKTLSHTYGNSRSWHWMRKVPTITRDVRIVGAYEGRGKMAGMLGGWYIQWGESTAKVGTLRGITMADRVEFWWNKEDYLQRLIEIEFKSFQPSGMPRQPRWTGRWRDDKDE